MRRAWGRVSPPQWDVADIFRHYGETYRAAHPIPLSHQKVMHDIVVCRTAQLGGHTEQCPTCGFERYASNSCRNRHCPRCQTCTQVHWVEARKAELLPVPYCHLVFTLPHDLNALILAHKRPLLTLLFKAASQTLIQFGQRNLGGQTGTVGPALHPTVTQPQERGAVGARGHGYRPQAMSALWLQATLAPPTGAPTSGRCQPRVPLGGTVL